jgi:hypothetical protein
VEVREGDDLLVTRVPAHCQGILRSQPVLLHPLDLCLGHSRGLPFHHGKRHAEASGGEWAFKSGQKLKAFWKGKGFTGSGR